MVASFSLAGVGSNLRRRISKASGPSFLLAYTGGHWSLSKSNVVEAEVRD